MQDPLRTFLTSKRFLPSRSPPAAALGALAMGASVISTSAIVSSRPLLESVWCSVEKRGEREEWCAGRWRARSGPANGCGG